MVLDGSSLAVCVCFLMLPSRRVGFDCSETDGTLCCILCSAVALSKNSISYWPWISLRGKRKAYSYDCVVSSVMRGEVGFKSSV